MAYAHYFAPSQAGKAGNRGDAHGDSGVDGAKPKQNAN
jgi:hypothetical protein